MPCTNKLHKLKLIFYQLFIINATLSQFPQTMRNELTQRATTKSAMIRVNVQRKHVITLNLFGMQLKYGTTYRTYTHKKLTKKKALVPCSAGCMVKDKWDLCGNKAVRAPFNARSRQHLSRLPHTLAISCHTLATTFQSAKFASNKNAHWGTKEEDTFPFTFSLRLFNYIEKS